MRDEDLNKALGILAKDAENEPAWRDLFSLLWPFVIAIVWRRLRDRTSAEDAAQEVFMRLVRTRPFPELSEAPQLRAYVWKVAINVSNDLMQKKRRQTLNDSSLADLGVPDGTSDLVQTEDRLIFDEALGLARSALAPEENALLVHLIQGRSIAETAAELGQTYSNTAVQMHRLRRKIYKLLYLQ